MIPTITLALFLIAAALVWWTPNSARYVASILEKRARAVNAARAAYKQAWDRGIQLPPPLVRTGSSTSTQTAESQNRGGCMGHA